MLVSDGLDVGGSYNLEIRASGSRGQQTLPPMLEPIDFTGDSLTVSLNGDLFVDLRPDPTWRAFLKTTYRGTIGSVGLEFPDLPFGGSREILDSHELSLHELFLDYTLLDRVYLRMGKQVIDWGYLFNPVASVGIGENKAFDYESASPGILAFKAHYPIRSNNLYFHALLDEVEESSQWVFVPKAEFVVGGTELGAGLAFGHDRPFQLVTTVSTTVGEMAVFGESVIAVDTDDSSDRVVALRGTVGGMYSYSDDDGLFNLTTSAQYMYNDGHQLGLMVNWTNILKSKFSASGMWFGSLGDDAGMLNLTLRLPALDWVKPSLGVQHVYGAAQATTVYFAVTMGSGSF